MSVLYTIIPPPSNQFGLAPAQHEADTVTLAVQAWAAGQDEELREWVRRYWDPAEVKKVPRLEGVWEVPGKGEEPLTVVRTAKPPKPKK